MITLQNAKQDHDFFRADGKRIYYFFDRKGNGYAVGINGTSHHYLFSDIASVNAKITELLDLETI